MQYTPRTLLGVSSRQLFSFEPYYSQLSSLWSCQTFCLVGGRGDVVWGEKVDTCSKGNMAFVTTVDGWHFCHSTSEVRSIRYQLSTDTLI